MISSNTAVMVPPGGVSTGGRREEGGERDGEIEREGREGLGEEEEQMGRRRWGGIRGEE